MPKNEITRIMSTNSHERTCAPLKLHPRNFTQPHSTAYYTKLCCSVAQYSPPILTLATLNPSNRQKPRHVALRSRVASSAAHRPPRKQTRHLRLLARVRAQHQIGGPMRSSPTVPKPASRTRYHSICRRVGRGRGWVVLPYRSPMVIISRLRKQRQAFRFS